jgi:hypothetical protein
MARQNTDPNQLSLLDVLKKEEERMLLGLRDVPGALNMRSLVRNALYEAIKASHLTRWEIAAKMSELTDQEISKYTLDTWTSESKEGHRFPLEYAAAFCRVTGSTTLLERVCQPVGMFALGGPDALRSQKQQLADQMAEMRKKSAEIDQMIKAWEKKR